MTKTMRNDPCPCGSGKKFKACCGGGDKTRSGALGGKILASILGVFVIGGAAIAINHFRSADLTSGGMVYDAESDRYFDPAHGHWHDGKPPAGAVPAAEGGTPEPFQYDALNNQYYDPEHGHWHPGAPPTQGGLTNPLLSPALPSATAPIVPANEQPPAVPADGSPNPWDYDADTDRHWNPNSGAWEQGMPPLEAFTSDPG